MSCVKVAEGRRGPGPGLAFTPARTIQRIRVSYAHTHVTPLSRDRSGSTCPCAPSPKWRVPCGLLRATGLWPVPAGVRRRGTAHDRALLASLRVHTPLEGGRGGLGGTPAPETLSC